MEITYWGRWDWDSPYDGETPYQRLTDEEIEELREGGIENESDYLEHLQELKF